MSSSASRVSFPHKLPFKNKVSSPSAPGEFFHSDVCGPIPTESVSGARYYVLFKDDYSGFKYVYFQKHKADVTDKFIELEKLVNNQFGRSMKILRTDNGREYVNDRMKKYLRERVIVHECSATYTPERNGKAEREQDNYGSGAHDAESSKFAELSLS